MASEWPQTEDLNALPPWVANGVKPALGAISRPLKALAATEQYKAYEKRLAANEPLVVRGALREGEPPRDYVVAEIGRMCSDASDEDAMQEKRFGHDNVTLLCPKELWDRRPADGSVIDYMEFCYATIDGEFCPLSDSVIKRLYGRVPEACVNDTNTITIGRRVIQHLPKSTFQSIKSAVVRDLEGDDDDEEEEEAAAPARPSFTQTATARQLTAARECGVTSVPSLEAVAWLEGAADPASFEKHARTPAKARESIYGISKSILANGVMCGENQMAAGNIPSGRAGIHRVEDRKVIEMQNQIIDYFPVIAHLRTLNRRSGGSSASKKRAVPPPAPAEEQVETPPAASKKRAEPEPAVEGLAMEDDEDGAPPPAKKRAPSAKVKKEPEPVANGTQHADLLAAQREELKKKAPADAKEALLCDDGMLNFEFDVFVAALRMAHAVDGGGSLQDAADFEAATKGLSPVALRHAKTCAAALLSIIGATSS